MSSRVLRVLVLACSLTLALPQGWCCLFAVQPARQAKQAGPCPRHGTPRCCCPCSAPLPSKSNPDPSPSEPTPAPIRHCPCTDRNTTPPKSAVEKIDADLGLVSFLPADGPQDQQAGVVEFADQPGCPPPHALHVLHCQWLC